MISKRTEVRRSKSWLWYHLPQHLSIFSKCGLWFFRKRHHELRKSISWFKRKQWSFSMDHTRKLHTYLGQATSSAFSGKISVKLYQFCVCQEIYGLQAIVCPESSENTDSLDPSYSVRFLGSFQYLIFSFKMESRGCSEYRGNRLILYFCVDGFYLIFGFQTNKSGDQKLNLSGMNGFVYFSYKNR